MVNEKEFNILEANETIMNLDYYIKSGTYTWSDDTAFDIINAPINTAFDLKVERKDGDIVQTLRQWCTGDIYYRVLSTGSSNWKKLIDANALTNRAQLYHQKGKNIPVNGTITLKIPYVRSYLVTIRNYNLANANQRSTKLYFLEGWAGVINMNILSDSKGSSGESNFLFEAVTSGGEFVLTVTNKSTVLTGIDISAMPFFN